MRNIRTVVEDFHSRRGVYDLFQIIKTDQCAVYVGDVIEVFLFVFFLSLSLSLSILNVLNAFICSNILFKFNFGYSISQIVRSLLRSIDMGKAFNRDVLYLK